MTTLQIQIKCLSWKDDPNSFEYGYEGLRYPPRLTIMQIQPYKEFYNLNLSPSWEDDPNSFK